PNVPWTMRLFAYREFRASYVPMRFRAEAPFAVEATAWILRDGKLGPERTDEAFVLPASFLAKRPGIAALDGSGEVVVVLPAGARVEVHSFDVPTGDWAFTSEGDPGLALSVGGTPGNVAHGPGRAKLVIVNRSPDEARLRRVVG